MIATRWVIAAGLLLAPAIVPTAQADEQWTASVELRRAMLSAWRESISAPSDDETDDLAEASRKLRELMLPGAERSEAGPTPTPRAAAPVTKAQPATQPKTPPEPTTKPAAKAVAPEADADLLKDMALEKLGDAAGAADALFAAGQYEAALTIYLRLKDHTPAAAQGDSSPAGAGRDWMVFQAANCSARLGRDGEAAKLYQQLLAQFPSSSWTAVAKVQGALAAWRQQEKPAELISTSLTEAGAARPASQPAPAPDATKTTEPK